jgi:hypothetical protein
MLKKLLTIIGLGGIASATDKQADAPYRDEGIHLIYQLLFCDRLDLYKVNHKGDATPPWSSLFADAPDEAVLSKIAEDKTQESRVRMLAFNRMRASKYVVPAKVHLGTIIEVSLPDGLDTLAVFEDGSARYINHSGKIAVVEGANELFNTEIQAVLKASKPIVSAIGPWDKARLPAPAKGNIRMSFLVSDGLYFGEGPMSVMQQDPMAAPLIDAATKLLVKLVEKTAKPE